ncbi:hypothetical protein IPA_02790 [Ignicoccus pacificus DSM 13166]|uniref:Uncharacterized protein n=1 Tax=Ignicoccus pacificus DSM 13166 TaxID=940294 RepID=A0A977KCN1_9CREN|nr:hypothetical protein IPA_02790 [Ignicoccus pacificus DSM 13166]
MLVSNFESTLILEARRAKVVIAKDYGISIEDVEAVLLLSI